MTNNTKITLRTIFSLVGYVVGTITILTGIIVFLYNVFSSESSDHNYEVYRSRIELFMEGIKDDIVFEIDAYIDSVASNSGINGIVLFELCDKYNVDVMFAMAQAEAESHFGTKGIAAKTNSVWNVKSYDGRSAEDIKKNNDHYKHPDDSIEPYLKLLTTSYLVGDKTEEDMFIKFVNKDNKRYASNERYEALLLNIYSQINEATDLKNLMKEYKKYKMILCI